MYRCPCCKELTIPTRSVFTLSRMVDCPACGAKLEISRGGIKEFAIIFAPVLLCYIAAVLLHLSGLPPRHAVGAYTQFLVLLGAVVSLICALARAKFVELGSR